MNDLQLFNNPEFGMLRIVDVNGKPYAVGADIARALGYARPNDAIAQHCKGAVKRRIGVQTGTKANGSPAMQNIDMLVIPEGDLYRLIVNSKLPSAEKFERWVFDEVLPAIRQTGGYIPMGENETEQDILARALLIADKSIKRLQGQLTAQQPQVIFANAVAASHTSILIGELAKLLRQNGIDMGQNRLFEWLRKNGYLISRRGTDRNMPTQRSMERGLFEIKETSISHSDGHITISKTPKVTGKGQIYFINKFKSGAA